MSIENHECRFLLDKYPGSDNTRVDKVRLGLWCLTPLQQYLSYIWWSVLLMEETGVSGENHRPVPSH